tara:strand:+ start:337 stop:720 length:384 start_codon:yes stop_codon:yes gene_type:complete
MSSEKVMKTTIIAGYLMVILGVAFYLLSQFVTALFPVLFGASLLTIQRLANNSSREYQATALAAVCSLFAVMLGISSAILGSWTTFTSLVEQIAMVVIAAAHLSVCVSYLANQAGVDNTMQTPEAIY